MNIFTISTPIYHILYWPRNKKHNFKIYSLLKIWNDLTKKIKCEFNLIGKS